MRFKIRTLITETGSERKALFAVEEIYNILHIKCYLIIIILYFLKNTHGYKL